MFVPSSRPVFNLLPRLRIPTRRLSLPPISRRPLQPSISLFYNKYAFQLHRTRTTTTSPPKTSSPDPSNLPIPTAPTILPNPLKKSSPTDIALSSPALVVTREYEWANILVGFEQANKYTIRAAPAGNVVGYLAEEESFGRTVTRNLLRTRRPFKATVFSPDREILFTIRRPMFLISSSVFVETPDGDLIGEIHMDWHLWRRRYSLYVDKTQFASVDSGFLAIDFDMRDENGHKIASVNKDFTGFARELFTDARQYVLRMDPAIGLQHDGDLVRDAATVDLAHEQYSQNEVGLRERAVILATAIAIDFDYFSVHSRGHMHPGLMMMPGGGGSGGEVDSDGDGNVAPVPPSSNTGMGGAGTVVGADVLSDIAQEQSSGTQSGGTADPSGPPTAQQDPFAQPRPDDFPKPDANVDSGDTAQQSEWATFEEADHGFQEDPYADENTWSGGGDDSWNGDGGGMSDGDGEGGGGVIGTIMDMFRIFSNDE